MTAARITPSTSTQVVAVDRVLCAGRGVCAEWAEQFDLDEWGYPVQSRVQLTLADAATVMRACPARALYSITPLT